MDTDESDKGSICQPCLYPVYSGVKASFVEICYGAGFLKDKQ